MSPGACIFSKHRIRPRIQERAQAEDIVVGVILKVKWEITGKSLYKGRNTFWMNGSRKKQKYEKPSLVQEFTQIGVIGS